MMMVVDVDKCEQPFDELVSGMSEYGDECGLNVRVQRQDIFDAMHKI